MIALNIFNTISAAIKVLSPIWMKWNDLVIHSDTIWLTVPLHSVNTVTSNKPNFNLLVSIFKKVSWFEPAIYSLAGPHAEIGMKSENLVVGEWNQNHMMMMMMMMMMMIDAHLLVWHDIIINSWNMTFHVELIHQIVNFGPYIFASCSWSRTVIVTSQSRKSTLS